MTDKLKVEIRTFGDEFQVIMSVGVQSFQIGPDWETAEEAAATAVFFQKALDKDRAADATRIALLEAEVPLLAKEIEELKIHALGRGCWTLRGPGPDAMTHDAFIDWALARITQLESDLRIYASGKLHTQGSDD